jgi:hypothetical protein
MWSGGSDGDGGSGGGAPAAANTHAMTALTVWLWGAVGLQLAQLPLRLHLAWRLERNGDARKPRARVVRAVSQLLSSLEWRINKACGSAAYWFLVVGGCLASYVTTWMENVTQGAAAAVAAAAAHAPVEVAMAEVLGGEWLRTGRGHAHARTPPPLCVMSRSPALGRPDPGCTCRRRRRRRG